MLRSSRQRRNMLTAEDPDRLKAIMTSKEADVNARSVL